MWCDDLSFSARETQRRKRKRRKRRRRVRDELSLKVAVTIMQHPCTLTETQTEHAVPKDALQEILERELCKGVLSWSSEGTLTGRARGCRVLIRENERE